MPEREAPPRAALFARVIGRSRLVVMVAVVAVMLSAISLFLLGAVLAAQIIWHAWVGVLEGEVGSTLLTVQFLEIVTIMLKAVFFYLIGVGLYSLFIAPLNLTVALGVETLSDLEAKIISVVVVILAVTFMERYIREQGGPGILWSAAAMAIAIVALVAFQWQVHRAGRQLQAHGPDVTGHAKVDLFEHSHEAQDLLAAEAHARAGNQKPSAPPPRGGAT